jgi:hypothetical protein
MDVRDGFIVGIFNYCDRWCEACAFARRTPAFVPIGGSARARTLRWILGTPARSLAGSR